jgi:hypothetical protein
MSVLTHHGHHQVSRIIPTMCRDFTLLPRARLNSVWNGCRRPADERALGRHPPRRERPGIDATNRPTDLRPDAERGSMQVLQRAVQSPVRGRGGDDRVHAVAEEPTHLRALHRARARRWRDRACRGPLRGRSRLYGPLRSNSSLGRSRQISSVLQASCFRCDVTVFRLNAGAVWPSPGTPTSQLAWRRPPGPRYRAFTGSCPREGGGL